MPARRVVLCVRCPGRLGSCSPVCPLGVLFCLCGVLGHLAPVPRCAHSVRCLCVRCPGPLGSCSPTCPLIVLCCVCGVLGHLAPVHRCARLVRCFASAVSWATWLLFTGVPARCVALRVRCPGPLGSCSPVCPLGVLPACAVSWATCLLFTAVPAWCVVLLVRCPGPLGSCSPVCPLGLLLCACGVLGHLAPVHRCARSVCCFSFAVSWATWLLFTGVPARCVACVCGVLGHLAPVHRCACLVCCFACEVSWATWLLFTGVPAWSFFLLVRCPGPLRSCSPLCPLGVLPCVCGVLGHFAPVHRCARLVCCFACAVSWDTWLLFTGVPASSVVLLVRCPGPLGSCSPVCLLGALLCLCGVLGHLAPFHRCARSVRCLCVRCPRPLGSCSPVCPLGVLFCVCGVLGDLAPVHRGARSVCCSSCAVSWATWLLFTGVPARCVAFVCGVLGHLAPVHQCARSACCFACAVSWATWLLFTGVPARCVALRVRCPGPLCSCSPVCPLGVLFCLCGVLGYLAPVHRCACFVCCFACEVSWATWLLFTGVPARCVALLVRCPGPLGSFSPVCPLGALPVCAVS